MILPVVVGPQSRRAVLRFTVSHQEWVQSTAFCAWYQVQNRVARLIAKISWIQTTGRTCCGLILWPSFPLKNFNEVGRCERFCGCANQCQHYFEKREYLPLKMGGKPYHWDPANESLCPRLASTRHPRLASTRHRHIIKPWWCVFWSSPFYCQVVLVSSNVSLNDLPCHSSGISLSLSIRFAWSKNFNNQCRKPLR